MILLQCFRALLTLLIVKFFSDGKGIKALFYFTNKNLKNKYLTWWASEWMSGLANENTGRYPLLANFGKAD